MKRYLLVVAVSLMAISGVSYADECTTWGCISTVDSLYTNANGQIYVSTPLDETKADCTVYAGGYFVLNPNAQNKKEIYATLLAAYMAGRKVQLRIVEGSPDCELSYVRLKTSFD